MPRAKRKRLRGLRTGAFCSGLVLLFIFQLISARRAPPLVKIGDIKPALNFSTVQVAGILKQEPRKLRNGSRLLLVDDGSGTLPVFVEGIADEVLPRAGSRIRVAGIVSMGARQNLRMTVSSAAALLVEAGGRDGPTLADIGPEQQGERITVSGRVARLWTPPPDSRAPHRIVLADEYGTLEVVHWLPSAPAVHVGDALEVQGTVQVYHGKLQLKVRTADHIRHPNDA